VYLRMGKADLGPIHAAPPALLWGDLCPVQTGAGPLAFVATGSMVRTALAVAPQWPNSAVWSAPSLKPLDVNQVAAICKKHQIVVALEEHSIHGGLGSAIAEIATTHAPTWVCRIGIQDRFSRYCGSYQYLMGEHHLDVEAVAQQVTAFLSR